MSGSTMASTSDRMSLVDVTAATMASALVLALILQAFTTASAAAQPGGTGTRGAYDWVPVVEPSASTVPEPPDGKWMKDEDGLEYTLFAWRKHEGFYTFDPGQPGYVKLNHILRLKVEHEDDQFLYLRWYKTAPIVESLAKDEAKEAEKLATIERSYTTEIASSDGLRLVPWEAGLPKSEQWRNGFGLADMNGDGHLDLVHGPPRKGSVTVPVIFLGDGAGSWRYWDSAKFPSLPFDYGDVAVGDLDLDGHQDIVLASHLTGFFALRGDGKGGFTAWSQGLPLRRSAIQRQHEIERELLRRSQPNAPKSPPPRTPKRDGQPGENAKKEKQEKAPAEPPAFTSRAIALADWNGDGRLDIVALSEGPTAIQDVADEVAPPLGKVIFLNEGDGTWKALQGPGQLMGDVVLPVDLDRDGHLDFVTDSRLISGPQIFNFGGAVDGSWTVGEIPEMREKLIIHSVAVDDFDRDARPDVALSFQSAEGGQIRQGVDLYRATGEARAWVRSSIYATNVQETEGMDTVVAGDVDSDGDADLVALTVEGNTWLFVNDGKGGFVRELSPEADPGKDHLYCAGYDAAVVDLDGDGRNELVASFAGEPGSEALSVGTMAQRCRARGMIRVWKVGPAGGESVELAPAVGQ